MLGGMNTVFQGKASEKRKREKEAKKKQEAEGGNEGGEGNWDDATEFYGDQWQDWPEELPDQGGDHEAPAKRRKG